MMFLRSREQQNLVNKQSFEDVGSRPKGLEQVTSAYGNQRHHGKVSVFSSQVCVYKYHVNGDLWQPLIGEQPVVEPRV